MGKYQVSATKRLSTESAAAKLLSSLKGNECDICKTNCKSYADLERHFKAEHPYLNPFPCPDNCGKRFSSVNGSRIHKRSCSNVAKETRELLKHQCLQCKRSYVRLDDLNRHIKRTHAIAYEKEYECEDCGKRFANKSNLNKHRRRQVCCLKEKVDEFEIKAFANVPDGKLGNDVPDGIFKHDVSDGIFKHDLFSQSGFEI